MSRLIALIALIPALAAADTPAAAKPYPLTTCIVSGEPLGSMGGAATEIHEGQEVKFCCRGCVRSFKKDPARYLAKLPAGSATAPAAPAPKP
ncbi:MAG: hypothetical protein RLZZ127_2054 [Planctomycetota bacterium]|jgi:hypothetical protein